jgi:hypothetical protein
MSKDQTEVGITGKPIPKPRTFEEFMSICEAKVPFARDAGNFKYPKKTGEEKALNKAERLSQSQSAKDRQRANKIRKTTKTVADRDTAQARSDAMTTHYRSQQKRANKLARGADSDT